MDSKKKKWLTGIMVLSAAVWSILVSGLLKDVEALLLPVLIVVWLFMVLQWTRR